MVRLKRKVTGEAHAQETTTYRAVPVLECSSSDQDLSEALPFLELELHKQTEAEPTKGGKGPSADRQALH